MKPLIACPGLQTGRIDIVHWPLAAIPNKKKKIKQVAESEEMTAAPTGKITDPIPLLDVRLRFFSHLFTDDSDDNDTADDVKSVPMPVALTKHVDKKATPIVAVCI